MSSTIKVNNIQNLAGDDSGLDLSTNDQVIIKTANTTAVTVNSSQGVALASNLDVGTIRATNGTTAMTINSSGLVLPKTPIVQVRAVDTDQSYTTGSVAKVQWQTVEIDTLSAFDSSNNRYTPTVAGYYLCGGALRVNLSSAVERFRCWISKNGSQASDGDSIHVGLQHTSDTIENSSVPLPTGLIGMNGSSDYIEVYFDSEENATLHDSTFAKSYFFAQLVHAT